MVFIPIIIFVALQVTLGQDYERRVHNAGITEFTNTNINNGSIPR